MSHWLLLYLAPMFLLDAYYATEAGEEMGYKVEKKAYRLKFEDRPGLEVTAASLPLGDFLNVTKLAGGSAAEAAENAADLFSAFADSLISWNIEDDNGPVTPDLAGIKTLDFDFVIEIVMAWVQAMGGVDNPLQKGSSNGETSLESMMPMSPSS
jgi:hypothetical protein